MQRTSIASFSSKIKAWRSGVIGSKSCLDLSPGRPFGQDTGWLITSPSGLHSHGLALLAAAGTGSVTHVLVKSLHGALLYTSPPTKIEDSLTLTANVCHR